MYVQILIMPYHIANEKRDDYRVSLVICKDWKRYQNKGEEKLYRFIVFTFKSRKIGQNSG